MPTILKQLLLQLLLILLNAFFAATEIAVISLNENKLRHQIEEGDKKASKMLKMVEEPTGFLSTIQIGITLAGFLGSAFAADNFSEMLVGWLTGTFSIPISEATLDTIAVIVITLILSYFTLVLGELVPKRIAMRNPEGLARTVCGIIIFLEKLLKPIVWFMTVSTNGMLRLFGINPHEEKDPVSEDDIRLMIDIGEEKGTIDPDEKEMIENIFEFNNTTVGEIMTHRTSVTFLDATSTTEEILDIIKESGYSRFPVYEESADDVIGVLIARDFLMDYLKKQKINVKKMVQPVKFVHEGVRADALFKEMQKERVHLAVVVDDFGGTAGIITLEDLLEEIVGNIYDESDEQTRPDITKLDENLWRVAGSIPIDDLCEELDIEIECESEEYKTLGGLIFSEMTSIPPDGSTPELDVKGIHVKVEEIIERRVEWALVSIIEPEEKENEEE